MCLSYLGADPRSATPQIFTKQQRICFSRFGILSLLITDGFFLCVSHLYFLDSGVGPCLCGFRQSPSRPSSANPRILYSRRSANICWGRKAGWGEGEKKEGRKTPTATQWVGDQCQNQRCRALATTSKLFSRCFKPMRCLVTFGFLSSCWPHLSTKPPPNKIKHHLLLLLIFLSLSTDIFGNTC